MASRYAPKEAAIILVEMQPEIMRANDTVSQAKLSRAIVALTQAKGP